MLNDPDGKRVGYHPDAKFVPPIASPFYVTVEDSGFSSKTLVGPGVWLSYSVTITFTADMSGIPSDRRGVLKKSPSPTATDDPRAGIAKIAESTAKWFVQRYDVLHRANSYIAVEEPGTSGFIEPFDTVTSSRSDEGGRVVVSVSLTGASRII
jgi:hypothetical protein